MAFLTNKERYVPHTHPPLPTANVVCSMLVMVIGYGHWSKLRRLCRGKVLVCRILPWPQLRFSRASTWKCCIMLEATGRGTRKYARACEAGAKRGKHSIRRVTKFVLEVKVLVDRPYERIKRSRSVYDAQVEGCNLWPGGRGFLASNNVFMPRLTPR